MTRLIASLAACALALPASAQNRIDEIRPDAPELAAYGDMPVGVRTLQLSDPGRVDVLNTAEDGEIATYDRPLTVEVWYPAAEGTQPGTTYTTTLRDGETQVELTGRAARDATPVSGETYPRSSSATAIPATEC